MFLINSSIQHYSTIRMEGAKLYWKQRRYRWKKKCLKTFLIRWRSSQLKTRIFYLISNHQVNMAARSFIWTTQLSILYNLSELEMTPIPSKIRGVPWSSGLRQARGQWFRPRSVQRFLIHACLTPLLGPQVNGYQSQSKACNSSRVRKRGPNKLVQILWW